MLQFLSQIRDTGDPSVYNTKRGALLEETYALFRAFVNGLKQENARKAFLAGEIIQKGTYQTRASFWRTIYHRYIAVYPEWIGPALNDASKHGKDSTEFRSLAYLYQVLRDRLMYDFITEKIWHRWQSGASHIDTSDYQAFISRKAETFPNIQKWSDYTRIHAAQTTLANLRNLGLLTGKRIKYIHQPAVSEEAIYHLLCILFAEGKRGKAIIDSTDWRLFLWDESDVSHALNRLSQKKWIRFEKGGNTVILELVRRPEDMINCMDYGGRK